MNSAIENMVGRILEPVFQSLPPETARRIVELKVDEALQRRVEILASKANEDDLSSEERQEYEMYIDAGDILATLQALARRSLRNTTSG